MINHNDSWTHRLPPEILATVASHLEDDESLIAATHVCHIWRATLLSSPRLWSRLDFENEERALVFLRRSKSGPLTVNLMDADDPSEIVGESLNQIAARVTTLRAEHSIFLDELLARPMLKLEILEVTDTGGAPPEKPTHLPPLKSLVISGIVPLRFHVPLLTSFHLTHDPIDDPPEWTGILLDFLRNCPLLEIVFLDCDVRPDSNENVPLPFLRSFTHESPSDEYQLSLFDRLSLPSDCRVVFMIDVTRYLCNPWIPRLPTPRDLSYLSDIRVIKITAHSHNLHHDKRHIMFKIKLMNSAHKAISFDRVSHYSDSLSGFSCQGFSGLLERLEIDSVETLCFDRYPIDTDSVQPNVTPVFMAQELRKFRNLRTLVLAECNVTLTLDGASSHPTIDTLVVYSRHRVGLFDFNLLQVLEFASSRKKAGYPLKAVTLVFPFAKPHPSAIEKLMDWVGWVKVMSGGDLSDWDADEYLLGAATHEDNSNRP